MCFLAFVLACCTADAEALHVAPAADDPRQIAVSVPWPDGLAGESPEFETAAAWLSLHVIDPQGQLGVAMLASYRRTGDRLWMVPRYPLLPGHTYRIRWHSAGTAGASAVVERDYRVEPAPAQPPPKVVYVFPHHAQVPANLLRFYIEFSHPMREGREVFERIELLDDMGQPVPDPWRPVELWSHQGRRLTLYLHPGRIKRGVNLREEIGPLMDPGRRYTLVVRATLSDTQGQPLGGDFVHPFTTLDEDRTAPTLDLWRIEPPVLQTREPLVVRFPKPLDRYLAARCLHVLDASGQSIDGEAQVAPDAQSWSFTPAAPWRRGGHALQVDEFLEDLAGNRPGRPFEVDLQAPTPAAPPPLQLPFQPR